jgi:hypothetical protein
MVGVAIRLAAAFSAPGFWVVFLDDVGVTTVLSRLSSDRSHDVRQGS